MKNARWPIGLAIVWLALAGGCAKPPLPPTGETPLQAASLPELRENLLDRKPDLDRFRLRGPFAVDVRKDFEVRLSATERFDTDLFLSSPAEKAPLVILLHGHDNSKEDHGYQALHLATWGMHSLALQLPNQGPWIGNGEKLARIAAFIHRRPEAIDDRIDSDRIVLIGHSFGGAAVAIALAVGAPAAGGILLDPAGVGKPLPGYLRKIDKPVMVIASDENVTLTRGRGDFYELIRSNVAEVSIANAHHEDAQFPLEPPPQAQGSDSSATLELQITFASALTSAAFSLGFTGNLDYAWSSFRDALASGRMFNPLRK